MSQDRSISIDDGRSGTGRCGRAVGALQELFTYQVVALLTLMRRSGTLVYRRLFDLSATEWRVMVQAGAYAPMTLNALADGIDRDAGQTSRVVKGLVARGLLASRRGPGGPAVTIEPTPAGLELHDALLELAAERDAWLIDGLSAEQIAGASIVLKRMTERAILLLEQEKALGAGTDTAPR